MGEIRSETEIAALRRTCREAASMLSALAKLVRPGITTAEIDAIAYEECVKRGAYPSTLNYNGFSNSICTSVNEVICHGIPDSRALAEGDIINLDVTIFREGVHGDCSATYLVGDVNPVARRLVAATREALEAGIAAVTPQRPLSDVGRAIEGVAARHGVTVVRDYVGHGIGPLFHTGLQVLHHFTPGPSPLMLPGMVFTIEPMLNAGTPRTTQWSDGWTAVTADLARSAQFEHTILVTDTGAEVLTLP